MPPRRAPGLVRAEEDAQYEVPEVEVETEKACAHAIMVAASVIG